MVLNAKTAKDLRAAAQYRQQSATPGVMPFPGVARAYKHPSYSTRVTTKTCYMKLPGDVDYTKVHTRVRRMVVDRKGNSIMEMETLAAGTVPVSFDDEGNPTAFNTETIVRPKQALTPVTKPARLDPSCAKARYRALKRLARKGLLGAIATGNFPADLLAADIINSQGKEVRT